MRAIEIIDEIEFFHLIKKFIENTGKKPSIAHVPKGVAIVVHGTINDEKRIFCANSGDIVYGVEIDLGESQSISFE